MIHLWQRGFKYQMLYIVIILLLVPLLTIGTNVLFVSKTDDLLIADLEKELISIVNSKNQQMIGQVTARLHETPDRNLYSLLEESFRDIAVPLSKEHKGVRMGLYTVEQKRILTEGFLHDYRPPEGEEQQRREQRIYNETIDGINAVVSGGTPITKLGQTWDDRFLEYLVPLYINNKLVAVVWAEKRMHPAFAKSARARQTGLFVALTVFIFGVGATVLSTSSLVKHVKQMKDGLVKLESDFNNLLPEMPGELGQITRAVNSMAVSLAEKEQLTEQLRRSEHLAALGRIVADIAHELRNPVSVMQATVELMEPRLRQEPELFECLAMINKQLEQQNFLIADLLSFGSPTQVKMEPIDVQTLLKSVVSSTIPLLKKSQITLDLISMEQVPLIVGNREKLTQVFVNIIINAVQAMPGGGSLTLQVFTTESSVCVSFRDTGEGISPEHLPQIFEPFYSKKIGGSGLGLTLSKRIVEIHSGSFYVESEPGQGTTFTVSLPY